MRKKQQKQQKNLKKTKKTQELRSWSLFVRELDLQKSEYSMHMVLFYKSYKPYMAKCIAALW